MMEGFRKAIEIFSANNFAKLEKVIDDMAQDILDNIVRDTGLTVAETFAQKVTILNELVWHNHQKRPSLTGFPGKDPASLKKSEASHKLWELVFEICTTTSETVPRCAYQFLVVSMICASKEDRQNYSERIESSIPMLVSCFENQRCDQNCQNILNLIEKILLSQDALLTSLCHRLTLRLVELLLEGDEVLLDGGYLNRISYMLSNTLRLVSAPSSEEIWTKIHHTFIVKGQHIVDWRCTPLNQISQQDKGSTVQYCLILMDILLEVAFCEGVASTATNERSIAVSRTKNLLSHPTTWIIIQFGMCRKRAFIRKLALYLLKKSLSCLEDQKISFKSFLSADSTNKIPLFSWDHEKSMQLLSIWKDFILIFETLEENQLHVIRPVLKRLEKLVALSEWTESEQTVKVHTSWICVVLQRMLLHESKAIIREGVVTSLKLDPSSLPFLEQETGESFLCADGEEGLFPSLQDVNLFCDIRDTTSVPMAEDPHPPVIASLLQEFLNRSVDTHENPNNFICFILRSLTQINWGPVPLYYICSSLSTLPKMDAWKGEDLHFLRMLITRGVRTHDARLRCAVQHTLLCSLMQFTNCSQVSVDEILRTVFLCDIKQLFCNQDLCQQISGWIILNFGKFLNFPAEMDGNISEFLMYKVEEYLFVANHQDNEISYEGLTDESRLCALLAVLIVQGLESSHSDAFSSEVLCKILSRISEITDKASTHLYMPKLKMYRAISLLNQLLTLTELDLHKDKSSLWKFLLKIFQGVVRYLPMQFPEWCHNFEAADLCLNACKNVIVCLKQLDPWKFQQANLFSGLATFVDSSLLMYKNSKGSCENLPTLIISLKCLSWILNIHQETSVRLDRTTSHMLNEFLMCLDLNCNDLPKPLNRDEMWGKKMEKYGVLQWSCLPYALVVRSKNARNVMETCAMIESFINQIDTVTESNIPTYLEALGKLIPVALQLNEGSEEIICEAMDVAWSIVENMTHSSAFWEVYRGFVKVCFQKSTLCLPASSLVQEKLVHHLSKIATLSTAKPALLHYAFEACIQSWITFEALERSTPGKNLESSTARKGIDVHSTRIHIDFVLKCLTFHHVTKKDDLAMLHVIKLVGHGGNDESGRNFMTQRLTMSTILILTALDVGNLQERTFAFDVLRELVNYDATLTQRKSRYHHNSVHHHMKNKIYQAVLLLLPFVPESEGENMVILLLKNLKNDAQPSVRYLMEWSLVMLLIRFPLCDQQLRSQLTSCVFGDDQGQAKFSAICSYLSVALLLGVGRCNERFQEEYFLDLIDMTLPWSMSQHFTIRLYALAVMLKIKLLFDEQGKTEILSKMHPALSSCITFADNATGNVGKNWLKMKDNFFLFDLDPTGDLSLQTVYSCLPRLCCAPSYVTTGELETFAQASAGFETGVKIFNSRDNLQRKTAASWILHESKTQLESVFSQEERYRKNYGDDYTENNQGNVQKKVMPWLEAMENASNETKLRPEGLILVASLIDKPSNLGGLTRTCEIFGAEALVVQSLSCTADKLYQSLSVTAHKWLPMKEVKPWQLEEYLKLMKSRGYTIIGTEQTAQSLCLSKFRFPKKCVVVLGNEKEGIPIPVLKAVDFCLQIPQKGVIRSLNVHVSGAITVWEYARQHLEYS